jgi:hypothetical protein
VENVQKDEKCHASESPQYGVSQGAFLECEKATVDCDEVLDNGVLM